MATSADMTHKFMVSLGLGESAMSSEFSRKPLICSELLIPDHDSAVSRRIYKRNSKKGREKFMLGVSPTIGGLFSGSTRREPYLKILRFNDHRPAEHDPFSIWRNRGSGRAFDAVIIIEVNRPRGLAGDESHAQHRDQV
jgi:hypothetical protein